MLMLVLQCVRVVGSTALELAHITKLLLNLRCPVVNLIRLLWDLDSDFVVNHLSGSEVSKL